MCEKRISICLNRTRRFSLFLKSPKKHENISSLHGGFFFKVLYTMLGGFFFFITLTGVDLEYEITS
jgi:hypothetical protein